MLVESVLILRLCMATTNYRLRQRRIQAPDYGMVCVIN